MLRTMILGCLLFLGACTSDPGYESVVDSDDTTTEIVDTGSTGIRDSGTADTGTSDIFESWIEADCTTDIGSAICDFTLMDQNSDAVALSDAVASGAVLLDFSAMWCGPCQSAAETSQALQDKYASYGLTYVTVLVEDATVGTVDLVDLETWATSYGVTAPVLAGSRDLLQSSGGPYYLQSWPTFYYISDTGVIEYYHGGYSEATLENNVEVLLGLNASSSKEYTDVGDLEIIYEDEVRDVLGL